MYSALRDNFPQTGESPTIHMEEDLVDETLNEVSINYYKYHPSRKALNNLMDPYCLHDRGF